MLLKDYARFGPAFEIDTASVFAGSSKYLNAVRERAHDRKSTAEGLAKSYDLDAALLKRWIEILAVEPAGPDKSESFGRPVPIVKLDLLDEKTPKNDAKPMIAGWRKKGTDAYPVAPKVKR